MSDLPTCFEPVSRKTLLCQKHCFRVEGLMLCNQKRATRAASHAAALPQAVMAVLKPCSASPGNGSLWDFRLSVLYGLRMVRAPGDFG